MRCIKGDSSERFGEFMVRLADPGLATRRRREILDAALYCFRRRGFHQATMQEICAEAGISPGALYRYFGSKADIIAAIAEDERREADLILRGRGDAAGLVDSLCLLARAFFEKLACDGGALLADVWAEAARDPHLAKSLAGIDVDSLSRCAAAIEAAQAAGDVDADMDSKIASKVLFACIEGLGFRQMLNGATDAEQAVAQFRVMAERFLAKRS